MKKNGEEGFLYPGITSLLCGEQINALLGVWARRALPGLWAERGWSIGLFTGTVPCPSTEFVSGNPTTELKLFAFVPTAAASLPNGSGNTSVGTWFPVGFWAMGVGWGSHSCGQLLVGHTSGGSQARAFNRRMFFNLSSSVLSCVTHRQAFGQASEQTSSSPGLGRMRT